MYQPQKSLERATALQKYLSLHLQRQTLEESLNKITIALSPTTFPEPPSPVRSRATNPSSSSETEENCQSPIQPFALQQLHRSRSAPDVQNIPPEVAANGPSLSAVIDDTILERVKEQENELNNFNEQIKYALKNLLSCDGVNSDERYRIWVQTRLEDTERKLWEFQRKRSESRKVIAAATTFFEFS